jgi:hypothetical protein
MARYPRAWLTAAQERKARRLLAKRCTRRDVAEAIGVSYGTLVQRLRDQLADVRTGRGGVGKNHRRADPSPDEIETATAAIREGWNDATRAERWVGRFNGGIPTDNL